VEHRGKFSQLGGYDKYTPLIYACAYGQFEVVKLILEKVPRLNINKGDKYKRTPLIMAVRNGHADIAALLIKHNAQLDLPDSSGNTPLHHASAYGWFECV
jgi:ankyrin repeat protein